MGVANGEAEHVRGITPKDLLGIPLISSRQHAVQNLFSGWLGYPYSRLKIAATYNLIANACELVRSGLGAVIGLDKLAASEQKDLTFRPFAPALKSDVYLAWKKGTPLVPAVRALIEALQ